MRAGAKANQSNGISRLNGADIARSEAIQKEISTVPLHTCADTTHGKKQIHKLGVKTWIYRDEVLPTRKNKNSEKGGK